MIYFWATRLTALLALVIGVASIAVGLGVASGWMGTDVMARYWPTSTSGEMIDRGIILLVAGVALGALSEIGFAVRRLKIGRGD